MWWRSSSNARFISCKKKFLSKVVITVDENRPLFYYQSTGKTVLEDGTIDFLPILEIEGYDFEGWYEDAGFTGNVVTEITIGSTGDKVYYAKLAEKLFEEVNVTFDAVGGERYSVTATIGELTVTTEFTVAQ